MNLFVFWCGHFRSDGGGKGRKIADLAPTHAGTIHRHHIISSSQCKCALHLTLSRNLVIVLIKDIQHPAHPVFVLIIAETHRIGREVTLHVVATGVSSTSGSGQLLWRRLIVPVIPF